VAKIESFIQMNGDRTPVHGPCTIKIEILSQKLHCLNSDILLQQKNHDLESYLLVKHKEQGHGNVLAAIAQK